MLLEFTFVNNLYEYYGKKTNQIDKKVVVRKKKQMLTYANDKKNAKKYENELKIKQKL